MRIQLSNVIKGLPMLVAALFAVSAFTFAGTEVRAEGNGSPEACDTGITATGDDDQQTYTASTGYVVSGVCIKSGENMFDGNQHSGVLMNGTYEEGCYEVSGVGTGVVTVERLGEGRNCQGLSHVDVLVEEEENETNYCDPSQKPGGVSIAQWIPADLKCVDFTVATTCGEVTATITKDDALPYTYAVSWSEGSANFNYDTALPATFEEDYNGGSVDVYYWLTGPEADYVTGEARNIPNYWDQTYGMVTVDTDCEDSEEPEVPTTPEEPTPVVQVLGDSDTRGGAGELPTSLPVTGANEQLAAIVTIVSTIATAAGVYTLRGRSADLSL